MTPTMYRDQVAKIAKTNIEKAAEIADKISDQWFAAQAWSHIARYADKPLHFARKAAKAALATKDDYCRSAVRAWEIAALAEREYFSEARQALTESVKIAESIEQAGSKAESFLLLFQAAFKISKNDAEIVAELVERSFPSTHWREKRARKDIAKMLNGEMPPREFYW